MAHTTRPPGRAPGQKDAAGLGAEPMRVGGDPYPPQVQPVCVPTRQQGPVADRVPIGVQSARLKQQVEAVVIEVDQFAAQRAGEFATPQAVAIILVLVHPPRIVEQGKQRDHLPIRPVGLSDPKPVLQHAHQWRTPWNPSTGNM